MQYSSVHPYNTVYIQYTGDDHIGRTTVLCIFEVNADRLAKVPESPIGVHPPHREVVLLYPLGMDEPASHRQRQCIHIPNLSNK